MSKNSLFLLVGLTLSSQSSNFLPRNRRHTFEHEISCSGDEIGWGGFYTDPTMDCAFPVYSNPITRATTCPEGTVAEAIQDTNQGYIWQRIADPSNCHNGPCGQRIFQCVNRSPDDGGDNPLDHNYGGMFLQCCNDNDDHHDVAYICRYPTTTSSQFKVLGTEIATSLLRRDPCYLTACWRTPDDIEHSEFGGCFMRSQDPSMDVVNPETGDTSCPEHFVAGIVTTALSHHKNCSTAGMKEYCHEAIYCCYPERLVSSYGAKGEKGRLHCSSYHNMHTPFLF